MYYAAAGGHSKTVRLLLAAPQLTTEAFAGAAAAAAAAGHMELAIMVLEALCARDSPATVAAEFQEPALGLGVLGQWEASESAVQEEEARWPAFQEIRDWCCRSHCSAPAGAGGCRQHHQLQ